MDFDRRKGRFTYLFGALLGLVAIHPFFELGAPRNAFLIFLALAIPATGVYAVSENRRQLILALALGALSLLGGLEALAGIDLLPGRGLALAFALAFYLYAAVSITAHVLRSEKVVADTLFGAACAYLLLGLVWTLGYTLLERLQPGSFSVPGAPTAPSTPMVFDFLYFSFVTLTTLGYGDITPLTGGARSLSILEAITGVLFVALLIARLVSMYERKQ